MRFPSRLVLALGASLSILFLATGFGQDGGPPPGTRWLLSTTTLDGIDRGLAENDPVPDPASFTRPRILQVQGARSGDSLRYAPGQLIVRFRDGVPERAREWVMSKAGADSAKQAEYGEFEILSIPSDTDPEELGRQISALPDVVYAHAAYRVLPALRPNDQFYSNQWNLQTCAAGVTNCAGIDMERAWDINPGATADIIVAVLDTGVAFRNVLLRYNAGAFSVGGTPFPALGPVDITFAAAPDLGPGDRFVAPRDFIWNDAYPPVDTDGHGTHVTGTVAQATNNGLGVAGVAYNVRIMPVKVIASWWDIVTRSPNLGSASDLAQAIRYSVDNGAKVLNMSLGFPAGANVPVVEEAMRYAVGQGAFIAVAAGNEFEDGNPVTQPAEFCERIEGAVAVSALARDASRAYYSSTGSYVELAAPGGDVLRFGGTGGIVQQTFERVSSTTYLLGPMRYVAPQYDIFQFLFYEGTSQATPHVAGFAALLYQQGITKPAAIEAAMKAFARDLGEPGRDDVYGAGLIDPRRTLRGLGLLK